MAKPKNQSISNILFVVIILLMILPQTRKPMQVLLQKAVVKIVKPKLLPSSEIVALSNYDWELLDRGETPFNLKSAEGKVIIINFWATWCPPCIAEMPSFENLYQSYGQNRDVVFLFVSQEKTETVAAYMSKTQMDLPFYKTVSNPPLEFNLSAIPRTFIIDKNREIVLDKSGAADWESDEIRKIIKSLLN